MAWRGAGSDKFSTTCRMVRSASHPYPTPPPLLSSPPPPSPSPPRPPPPPVSLTLFDFPALQWYPSLTTIPVLFSFLTCRARLIVDWRSP
eukprot:244447-Hanusia_phi.AAC.2